MQWNATSKTYLDICPRAPDKCSPKSKDKEQLLYELKDNNARMQNSAYARKKKSQTGNSFGIQQNRFYHMKFSFGQETPLLRMASL